LKKKKKKKKKKGAIREGAGRMETGEHARDRSLAYG